MNGNRLHVLVKSICRRVFQRPATAHRTVSSDAGSERPKTIRSRKTRSVVPATGSSNEPCVVPKDVQEYFQSKDAPILDLFPATILRKGNQTTERFYVADRSTARHIADVITRDLPEERLLLEVNPGPGLLTEQIFQRRSQNVQFFETDPSFEVRLKKLGVPSNALRTADFNGMWRMEYMDSFDGGQRVANLLTGLPQRKWQDEVSFRLFSIVGSVKYLRYLMNSITQQNEFYSLGRYEMILLMSPLLFSHIASTTEAGYKLYRGGTIVFQLYFDHEFLGTIPRKHFVPWFNNTNPKKIRTLHRKLIDDGADEWYLVKIVPRKDLFEYIQPDNLTLFASFVMQHYVSRKNRVIPTLEHWIPHCGSRLIMNANYATVGKVPPSPLPSQLLKSVPLVANDFLDKMTIYTEFGELTPAQVLTLFNEFINWPEFHQSPFIQAVGGQKLKQRISRRAPDDEESIDGPSDGSTNISNVRSKKAKNVQ
ncbi:dimethyladenosine transferase 2, mitochondrial [Anopheles bellator]|uniref:dimethyladenosine transferase 2, mitochondrial n=1 Tax=Anopheles bellator TaxID=139047 RepID=UPI002647AAF8|nr:dimethyladenosine transferase 2, mitochondrial [Anopheles bellator]